ncbi:hypothetical protein [Croceicoccus gelatinilyticus]|uniref:hypothetical protein n=1 Tax=Croceicoccus gelatinilyticus TaxID=2835536 RepID=UPI001BD17313|nr:hypothetical protein [Croceicoccus gelatinilyticus]MBS7671426.1 hypothetical protein [Croceicoccus gelatinilyticus]
MTFQSHTRYRLKDPEHYDDEYGKGYDHVEAYEGADGCYIADCWVVNAKGDIHPGYAESPIPINFNSLVAKSAVPGNNESRRRSGAMWR